jgi:hypothetical protein
MLHSIDLGNSIIGKIHFKENSVMNSTNEFLKEEYRCYLTRSDINIYLRSFDTLPKAIEYLIHLSKAKNENFVWE